MQTLRTGASQPESETTGANLWWSLHCAESRMGVSFDSSAALLWQAEESGDWHLPEATAGLCSRVPDVSSPRSIQGESPDKDHLKYKRKTQEEVWQASDRTESPTELWQPQGWELVHQTVGWYILALTKGFNFAPAPKKVPTAHLVTIIEAAIRRLGVSETDCGGKDQNKHHWSSQSNPDATKECTTQKDEGP